MPSTLSTVVVTMKATIHTQNGTSGNFACRYTAPNSQITIGRKK